MEGDKWKELIDSLGEGVWEEEGWPTNFEAVMEIYEEASRKIRY